ncbi:siphovirus Gp157 family protein [Ensifer canadensis]
MVATDVEYKVRRQMEAAKSLLASLREQGVEDDAELVVDTIEGETNLVEAIDAALAQIDECEVQTIGLSAKIEAFEGRKKTIGARADRLRALIEQAMLATDQDKLKLPTATLSLTKRAPGLVVINEADIPVEFWIEQERPAPKLDKKALTAALREENAAIPGATLDNGSFSLSVRRK